MSAVRRSPLVPRPTRGLSPARLAARLALVTVSVSSLTVSGAFLRAWRAHGWERLLSGDFLQAQRVLAPYPSWLDFEGEARAGLLLARVGVGDDVDDRRGPVPEGVLLTLMEGALGRGDAAGTERFARLGLTSGDAWSAPYLAAAQVELGHLDEARRTLESIPHRQGIAALVETALLSLEEGASTQLFDRRGRPLGWLTPQGDFRSASGVSPELIPLAILDGPAPRSGGLRLSIDLELSRLALGALGRHRGSIVLVEPATGSVLAAVSDARTSRRDGGTPAFEQRREPASIAKLITTAAVLRSGLDPDTEISRMTCSSMERYDGGILYCPYRAGRLKSLDRAMAVSCNVAFANLAVKVGRGPVLAEFRRFGFDRADVGAGRILVPQGDDRQLADLSIGLEATDITPLHGAMLAAVIANGGAVPIPRLVEAHDGRMGRTPRPLNRAPAREVIEPAWAEVLHSSMRAVAQQGGTGQGLSPSHFPVAMKTGTASEPGRGYHVNHIGFGPEPAPRVAFSVRVTHQRTSRRGGAAARAVTRSLLRRLARIGWPGRPSEPMVNPLEISITQAP